MSRTSDRRLGAGAAIILVACLTAVGSYQKLRDLDRSDSALYAYGGFLIEQGGQLYRDVWDHKPPGVYAIDALAFRLAGGASWAAAVAADTLATLLTILACAGTARRVAGAGAAAVAALLAAFYLNLAAFHEGGGMAETYMAAFLAWAGWAFVAAGAAGSSGDPQRRARRAASLLAISGALAGLAILCKPTAMTAVAACMVALAVKSLRRRRPGGFVRGGAVYLAGLAVPLVLAGLVFFEQGSLRDLVDASLLYNLGYVQRGAALGKLLALHLRHNLFLLPGLALVLGAAFVRWVRQRVAQPPSGMLFLGAPGRFLPAVPEGLPSSAAGVLTGGPCGAAAPGRPSGAVPESPAIEPAYADEACPGGGHARLPRARSRSARYPGHAPALLQYPSAAFLFAWPAFEWLGAYAGNFDNGQYMFGTVVALSPLAGLAGAYLLRCVAMPPSRAVRTLAAASLLAALLLAAPAARDQWLQTLRIARAPAGPAILDQLAAAGEIRRNSRPGDRIWVWGYAPQVYLAARRPPATRFIFDGVFLNSPRVLLPQFRQMLADLDRRRPLYIVDAATTGWFAVWLKGPVPDDLPPQPARYRRHLARLQEWVAAHYEPVGECGELVVYRRRPVPPDGTMARSPPAGDAGTLR